jgi:hypothetical protein
MTMNAHHNTAFFSDRLPQSPLLSRQVAKLFNCDIVLSFQGAGTYRAPAARLPP